MKKIFSFLLPSLLILATATSANAQTYIDEDFLDVLEKNAQPLLSDPEPAFKATTIPAKWDKESAVILGYSRSILFDKKTSGGFFTRKERSLYFLEKTRLRIKLGDNNSVDAFSQIYFRYGDKQDGFIAQIVKPDGTTTKVDLGTAVGVEIGRAHV